MASDDDDALRAERTGGEQGEKKGSKKLLIVVAVILLLIVGGGAGAYFTGMLDSLLGKSEATEEEGGEHGEAKGHGEKKDGHAKKGEHGEEGEHGEAGAYFLQIPDLLVNLNADGNQNRYLRLSVQLEVGSEADKAAVEAVMPRVVDQFQTYLRELRVKDLRGSAGIYRLQMELLNRVNTAAYPVEVKDVLFQEILIQ